MIIALSAYPSHLSHPVNFQELGRMGRMEERVTVAKKVNKADYLLRLDVPSDVPGCDSCSGWCACD